MFDSQVVEGKLGWTAVHRCKEAGSAQEQLRLSHSRALSEANAGAKAPQNSAGSSRCLRRVVELWLAS